MTHFQFVYFQLEQCLAPQATATSTTEQASGEVASGIPNTPDDPDAPEVRGPTPPSSYSSRTTAPRGQHSTRGRRGDEADDQLLASLQDQGTHLMTMQQQLLEHLKPQGDQERLGFVEFVRSTLLSLNHDCWRRCQKDMLHLLMRYVDENETARRSQPTSSATYAPPNPPPPAPAASCYPGPSSASYGQAPSQHMWQPPPNQWLTDDQNPTSVWGSMEPCWLQQECVQSNTSCSSQARPWTAPTAPSTSTPDSFLRLSGLRLLRDLDTDTLQVVDQSGSARASEGGESQSRRISD